MDIDKEIDMAEKDLKDLKARKKSREDSLVTKERADKGKKRSPYLSGLPVKYRSYLNRANKRGMVFQLTVQEFESICMHPCVYCGSTSKIGVDRLDSSDGYTLENSQPCCSTCNMMKYTYNEEQFLQQVTKIFRYRS